MSIENGKLVAPVGLGDISSVVHRVSGDLGDLIDEGYINACALWKPFDYPAHGFASVTAQRNAVREVHGGFTYYGTSLSMPIFAPASWTKDTHNTWTYCRPTGGNHPYRALDFGPIGTIDGQKVGYREDAPSPVGVIWPTFVDTAERFFAVIQVGSASYGHGGGTWDKYNCLSFDDIFRSDGEYAAYHFALLIKRQTSAQASYRTMIISPATVANIETSTYAGSATMAWQKEASPVTSGMSINNVIDCCVCLVPFSGTMPSGGECAVVNDGDPYFPGTAVSLEIKQNIERESVVVVGGGSIAHMALSNAVISVTKQSSSDIAGHEKYKIDSISFIAGPGEGWGNITTVSGTITLELIGGMMKHNGTGNIVGATIVYGDSTNPYALAISSSTPTATYSYDFGNTIGNRNVPFDLYAYKPNTASSLTLKLTVSFTYDTTVPIDATATLT